MNLEEKKKSEALRIIKRFLEKFRVDEELEEVSDLEVEVEFSTDDFSNSKLVQANIEDELMHNNCKLQIDKVTETKLTIKIISL